MAPAKIDASLARELVRTQFPQWAELTVTPVDRSGWDNRTYRLGAELALRLPSAAEYAAQVKKEQEWLPQLAAQLPLPIPEPVAVGAPGHGFAWPWSVLRWLDGEDAAVASVTDAVRFARELARFLRALQRIDATGGPAAGPHSFWRGGPLRTYDAETREALSRLAGEIDCDAVLSVWEAAFATTHASAPVWVHGDVAPGNLLVKDGRLSAVIDFGLMNVGDPACDLSIAWTFFAGESRRAFRDELELDDDTWARARAWALWKALITIAALEGTDPAQVSGARRTLVELLRDPHARGGGAGANAPLPSPPA